MTLSGITGKSFCVILDEICTFKCAQMLLQSQVQPHLNYSVPQIVLLIFWKINRRRLSASKIVLHVSKVVEVPITETITLFTEFNPHGHTNF